ncbi:MAG: exo-alpha-sialidase [Chloroflexota bacterium]
MNPLPLDNLLEWRSIGPYRGGRVIAVAGDPTDSNTFYFGACAGGVWKTTDAGLYWECVSDGFFQSSSMGAIAVSESDPNVIYAGTGESTARSNISPGDGVYKSTDAGRTWQHVGLRDSRHIGKIIIHPQNPDLVYVAALGHAHGSNEERGVFRSRDGGQNWERILYKSDKAGAVDIKLDPQNPRILFASIWQMKRSFWDMSSGGEDCGLYRSQDGGDSWEELSGQNGLPGGLLGKIGIAISPAQKGRVWALVETTEKPGLYRSDDYGETWSLVSADGNLNARAWYYTHLTADTQDANTLYVNCFKLWKSIDGGHNFTQIGTPHGDNHDLWIDPNNNQRMIQGNDGGACVSLNGGASWSSIFNQPTAQFYRIGTDNQYPYRVYGTQQDNSSVSVPSRAYERGAIPWAAVYQAGTGESGHIAVRPDDPNIVYVGAIGSSPGGGNALQRYDHRTQQIRLITPWPEANRGHLPSAHKYRFNWTYPIVISPHDPDTLYIAGNQLLRSQDEGQSWQEISPDLTRADPSTFVASGGPINKEGGSAEMYATIFAFTESPHEPSVFWTGSDDGLIHLSRDGGATWQNVTPAIMPEWAQISTIEPSPFNPAQVYVAATRNKADDFRPYLFKTADFGQTWQAISDGIPDDDFTRVIRADPGREGLLYAGTESTVYVSFDDGDSWQSLQFNLPVTPVYDLKVKDNDLVAGTHGRSFWILDDLTPLHQIDETVEETAVFLFKPRDTVRALANLTGDWAGGATGKNYYATFSEIATHYEEKSEQGTTKRRFLDVGENPPVGVVITYHLAEVAQEPVMLTILDGAGNEINNFQSDAKEGVVVPVKQGINRFVWDMQHSAGATIKGKDLSASDLAGPIVAPGEYQVRLQVGETTLTEPFAIIKDPRVETAVSDLQAQVKLLLAIRDKLSHAHTIINAVRDCRQQVSDWMSRFAENQALQEAGTALQTQLRQLEEPLIVPELKTRSEVGNHGVRLLAKLAGLTPVVAAADFAPTEASHQFFGHISAEIDAQLVALEEAMATEVRKFNRLLQEVRVQGVWIGR